MVNMIKLLLMWLFLFTFLTRTLSQINQEYYQQPPLAWSWRRHLDRTPPYGRIGPGFTRPTRLGPPPNGHQHRGPPRNPFGQKNPLDPNRYVIHSSTTGKKPEHCPPCPDPPPNRPEPLKEDAGLFYDPRYVANTLEEAILNFPDLTNPTVIDRYQPPPLPAVGFAQSRPVLGQDLTKQDDNYRNRCPQHDIQCQTCASSLLDMVQHSGLINSSRKIEISQRIGIDLRNQRSSNGCNRYRFAQNIPRVDPKSQAPSFRVPVVIPSPEEQGFSFAARAFSEPARKTEVGTTFEISCIKRGDAEKEGNDSFVVTCDMCWCFRLLPEGYSPRYINELKCGKDSKCLAGYGECQQRVKVLSVKYNGQSVDISTNTCCDCKVQIGSPLHSFIAK